MEWALRGDCLASLAVRYEVLVQHEGTATVALPGVVIAYEGLRPQVSVRFMSELYAARGADARCLALAVDSDGEQAVGAHDVPVVALVHADTEFRVLVNGLV
jgi:hypothetical protein